MWQRIRQFKAAHPNVAADVASRSLLLAATVVPQENSYEPVMQLLTAVLITEISRGILG